MLKKGEKIKKSQVVKVLDEEIKSLLIELENVLRSKEKHNFDRRNKNITKIIFAIKILKKIKAKYE